MYINVCVYIYIYIYIHIQMESQGIRADREISEVGLEPPCRVAGGRGCV